MLLSDLHLTVKSICILLSFSSLVGQHFPKFYFYEVLSSLHILLISTPCPNASCIVQGTNGCETFVVKAKYFFESLWYDKYLAMRCLVQFLTPLQRAIGISRLEKKVESVLRLPEFGELWNLEN